MFELAMKSSAVMAPAVTVKLFDVTKQLLPQIVLNGKGEGNVKAAFEMLSMMTAVAAEVPFVRPSISPVTVAGHPGPTLQPPVNEKPKFSAWPADGNKPNKAMTAMRLNNFDFMDAPPKNASRSMTKPSQQFPAPHPHDGLY
jgi:hypothetical protein